MRQKINKNGIVLAIVVLMVLIIIPIFLNFFIFENEYITKVSNDGWASFFGSYIGGAIGGIGTLIAMYISVRETQKQIVISDVKDKKKERVKEAEVIAELVTNYIGEVNIYQNKEKNVIEEKNMIAQEISYFDTLLIEWKHCRYSRFFSNYRDYIQQLEAKRIGFDYAKRYFENNISSKPTCNIEVVYNDYEKELEEKIHEYYSKLRTVTDLLEDYKQKNIVGNNSVLLLDIKLNNIAYGAELWKKIKELHETIEKNDIDIDVKNQVEIIKNVTREFVIKHISS